MRIEFNLPPKKQKIEFKLKKQDTSKDYHLTNFRKISKGLEIKSKILKEIKLRDEFTRKFYSGRYDERHLRVMHFLGQHLNIEDKIRLPLTAYSVISKIPC